MKKFVLFLLFAWMMMFIGAQLTSCDGIKNCDEVRTDTVFVEVPVYIEVPRSYEDEKLTERIEELERDVDYYKIYVDSTKNTIEYKNYINERRIEKIKYYITITERNPNNKKFFYGWVKRTMSD